MVEGWFGLVWFGLAVDWVLGGLLLVVGLSRPHRRSVVRVRSSTGRWLGRRCVVCRLRGGRRIFFGFGHGAMTSIPSRQLQRLF